MTGCPKSRQIQCSVISPSHWVLQCEANKVPEPLSYKHWFHSQGHCPLWFSHFPQTPPSHGAHRRVKSQHWMLLLICWRGPSFLSNSATPFPASSLTTLCILCIFILTAPGRGGCSLWATQISCICYSVEECSKTVVPAYVWYWLFGLPAGWHWRTISNFPMFPNSSVTSMKLLDKVYAYQALWCCTTVIQATSEAKAWGITDSRSDFKRGLGVWLHNIVLAYHMQGSRFSSQYWK